jgi:hypothetical protein
MPGAQPARPRSGPALANRSPARNARRVKTRGVNSRTDVDGTTPDSPATQLPQALRAIGSVVAPVTLITAVMFYFGVQHAHWYFHYFGVNHTIMGLTTQDYLIRSADGLFVPLTGLAGAILLSLWTIRLATARLPERRKQAAQRAGAVASAVLGAFALIVAVIGDRTSALPGLCLSAGVLLMALASNLHWLVKGEERSRLPGWIGLSEWGALFIVVSIGLFWSVTNYSAAVGEERAYSTALKLTSQPEAFLYSRDRLSIPASSAREMVCSQPEGSGDSYRYRYDGLNLVFATADQYMFLPSDWPAGGGIAIVLPRTDPVRLEFLRPDLAQTAEPPTGACAPR